MARTGKSGRGSRLSRLEAIILILGAGLFLLSLHMNFRPVTEPQSDTNTNTVSVRNLPSNHIEENAKVITSALEKYFVNKQEYPAFLVGGSNYLRLSDPLTDSGCLDAYPPTKRNSKVAEEDSNTTNLYVPRGTELFDKLAQTARPTEPLKPHEPTPPSWMTPHSYEISLSTPYHAFGHFEPSPSSLVRESPIVISIRLYMCSFVRKDASPIIESFTVNGKRIAGKITPEDDYFLIKSEPIKLSSAGQQDINLIIDDRNEYFLYKSTQFWRFTYDPSASDEEVKGHNNSPEVLKSPVRQLQSGRKMHMEKTEEINEQHYEEEAAERKREKEGYEKLKKEYPTKLVEYEKQVADYNEELRYWQKLNELPSILCAGGAELSPSKGKDDTGQLTFRLIPEGAEAVFVVTGHSVYTVFSPFGHFGYVRGDFAGGGKDTALLWMYGDAPPSNTDDIMHYNPKPFGLDILNAKTGEIVPDGIPDGVVLFYRLVKGEVAEVKRADQDNKMTELPGSIE